MVRVFKSLSFSLDQSSYFSHQYIHSITRVYITENSFLSEMRQFTIWGS